MHLVQIGSEAAAEAAAEAAEEVYTDNNAIPSLALSFELGLRMAIGKNGGCAPTKVSIPPIRRFSKVV